MLLKVLIDGHEVDRKISAELDQVLLLMPAIEMTAQLLVRDHGKRVTVLVEEDNVTTVLGAWR